SMIPLPARIVSVADPYSLDTLLPGDPKRVSPMACDPAHLLTLCACLWLWASPDPPAEVQQFYATDPAPQDHSQTGLGPGLLGVSVATQLGPLRASPGGALISLGLTTISSQPCP